MCDFMFTFDWYKKKFDKKCILCSNYSSCKKSFKFDDPLLRAPCADFLQASKPTFLVCHNCHDCLFFTKYADGQFTIHGCDYDLLKVDSFLKFRVLHWVSARDCDCSAEKDFMYNLDCPNFFPRSYIESLKEKIRSGEIKYEKS